MRNAFTPIQIAKFLMMLESEREKEKAGQGVSEIQQSADDLWGTINERMDQKFE